MVTPASFPAPIAAPTEDSEDEILRPSDRPTSLAPASEVPFEVGSGWQPAPPPLPSKSRRNTLEGFHAVRPESSMYAGGTILNWAGRVPEIETIDEVSGRETLEVGQWDHTLEELREDPEVEEAIFAIDSDPPPGAFVRSRPPSDRAIDDTVGGEQHRDAVLGYHEPPEVDPPPLTYAQVFEEEAAEASIRAPRAVQPSALIPKESGTPMHHWAWLVLAMGCGVAAVLYWISLGGDAVPAPVAAPVPAPVTAPVAVPAPAPAGDSATSEPGVPAPDTDPPSAAPSPNPNALYPPTGAVDTYEAQLELARRLKRGSRAVAAYRRAIELNPEGSPALAELARLMLARSHSREASELAERATAIDPSNALAWVTLGAARQMRGDRQGARQAYQNCAKLGKGQYVSECRAMLR